MQSLNYRLHWYNSNPLYIYHTDPKLSAPFSSTTSDHLPEIMQCTPNHPSNRVNHHTRSQQGTLFSFDSIRTPGVSRSHLSTFRRTFRPSGNASQVETLKDCLPLPLPFEGSHSLWPLFPTRTAHHDDSRVKLRVTCTGT
ncbi:hypothetical protein FA15DRAFT_340206 [Coprinopsis marcescibilis]|uniref:Uncharacterized protein n=1 Tax=Coprinopsis marcescibilis TaxID=230819 RepID=A0A5C3KZ87_COPMA|nr:hypothetical protein FA15DRAFT_340206 [Coprinopsis marcescibilis]